jgi:DNA-binding CsgD family transcriptional regulator
MFIELAIAQPKLMRRSGVKGVITGREKEVLKMLVSGLSNEEISVTSGIVERTERTVKADISGSGSEHSRRGRRL